MSWRLFLNRSKIVFLSRKKQTIWTKQFLTLLNGKHIYIDEANFLAACRTKLNFSRFCWTTALQKNSSNGLNRLPRSTKVNRKWHFVRPEVLIRSHVQNQPPASEVDPVLILCRVPGVHFVNLLFGRKVLGLIFILEFRAKFNLKIADKEIIFLKIQNAIFCHLK
jgi:hypothetical protein